jgi:hypothetical protein
MRHKKYKFLPLLLFFLLFGCYRMDKKEDLSIHVPDSRVNYDDFKYYIDSVLNKKMAIPDSIKVRLLGDGHDIKNSQRIIYFDSNPEECFLINFYGEPMIVERLVNMDLSNDAIYRKDDLSEEEIERIEKKFRVELLDKVVAYTRNQSSLKSSTLNKVQDMNKEP